MHRRLPRVAGSAHFASFAGVLDLAVGVPREATLLSRMHGSVARPRQAAELRALVVAHGLLDLVARVHHERTVPRDRLAERLAGDEQHARRPLRGEAHGVALAEFGEAELVWVQEEPENQGAWTFVTLGIGTDLGRPLRVVSRPRSASPATGSSRTHLAEQAALVEEAFAR